MVISLANQHSSAVPHDLTIVHVSSKFDSDAGLDVQKISDPSALISAADLANKMGLQQPVRLT